jgi:hypothetical protein
MKLFPLSKAELEELILILEEAVKYGYSTLTPPLIPMLEVLIDLNLRVSEFFKVGGPLSERNNPALKELDIADALGNTKMIKLFDVPKWVRESSQISFIFKRSAEGLVRFKKSGNPIDLATFAVTKIKKINRPSVKKPKESQKEHDRNTYWYFQRKARTRYKKQVIT